TDVALAACWMFKTTSSPRSSAVPACRILAHVSLKLRRLQRSALSPSNFAKRPRTRVPSPPAGGGIGCQIDTHDPKLWSGRASQGDFVDLADAVLHQCIRPLIGALLPAIMDISARATSLDGVIGRRSCG